MTITTSSLGGGGLPRLAPDLTFPSGLTGSTTQTIYQISGIDASAGLTTAINLSGKWEVSAAAFRNLTAESSTFKLTVDGVVIWNAAKVTGTAQVLLGGALNSADTDVNNYDTPIQCNTSFLLEIQTTSDNSISFEWMGRPIL